MNVLSFCLGCLIAAISSVVYEHAAHVKYSKVSARIYTVGVVLIASLTFTAMMLCGLNGITLY